MSFTNTDSLSFMEEINRKLFILSSGTDDIQVLKQSMFLILKLQLRLYEFFLKEMELPSFINNMCVFTHNIEYRVNQLQKSVFTDNEPPKYVQMPTTKNKKIPIDLEPNLYDAIVHGKLDSVKYFVERGEDLGLKALQVAIENDHLQIVKYFIEESGKKIDINARDSHGNALLHIAAKRNNVKIIKYLLSKGAKKTPKNEQQQKPSDLTRDNEALKLLS